ncbi:hypothetical protein [Streptomyces sp. NBC_00887]|uniref:hypothetical protein n=1 Tax=Streptomyces sp. NBC_00887 TaxID=2975859 RepID=UPI00386DD903|nr:hypothetical protein OG844_32640 [Streptomyces sp. NBC_00887]
MKHDAKRRRLFSLFALPGLLVTGCAGFGGERPCTLIGGESGVVVSWEPADFADSGSQGSDTDSGSLVTRLCAQEVCESGTVAKNSDDSAPHRSSVALDGDIGEVTVQVRFTVTSRDDGKRVIFDERTDVELRKSQPNGKGCGPTIFRAGLTADPERGLIADSSRRRQFTGTRLVLDGPAWNDAQLELRKRAVRMPG